MILADDIVRYDGTDWDLNYEGDGNPDAWVTDNPAIWYGDDIDR